MKVLFFDADQESQDYFAKRFSPEEVVFVESAISKGELLKHADADVLSVFVSSVVKPEHIDALPNLKLIASRSTGVDHIDVAHAVQKGVAVANVPRYGSHAVAEFTFALLLSLTRRLYEAARQVKEEGDFDIKGLEGFNLFGKTIGVVGTGSIGRVVVGLARGFGMRVLMYNRDIDHSLESECSKYVSMEELLKESDVVTLHLPYTKETHHFLGRNEFARMKRGALLINAARGELVDTVALVDALKSGSVGGAGLDVIEEERGLKDEMTLVRGEQSIQELKMAIADHVLMDMPSVIVTPHIAFFSKEAYEEILSTTADNIEALRAGKLQNIVKA